MKKSYTLQIFTLPFLISAAINFLPAWVWIPFVVLASMQWLGALILSVGELRKQEAEELLKKEADAKRIITS